MAVLAGPGHLEADDRDEGIVRILLSRFLCFLPQRLTAVRRHFALARVGHVAVRIILGVVIVRLIGDRKKVDLFRILCMLQRLLKRTGTVGVFRGMRMQLAEVKLEGRNADREVPHNQNKCTTMNQNLSK